MKRLVILSYTAILIIIGLLLYHFIKGRRAEWEIVLLSAGVGISFFFYMVFHTLSREVTERKKAEQEAGRLSHKYELIFKSMNEGLAGFDSEGRPLFINQAALRMLGFKREELEGRNAHDLIHGKRTDGSPYPLEECPMRDTLVNGVPHAVTGEVFWRKDGTSFPVEYASNPILEEGRITGSAITFRDVTKRIETEKALQQANETLAKWLNEVEQRNREIELLSEMGSLFQACAAEREVYEVIKTSVRKLFPLDSGSVFLLNEAGTLLESAVIWGEVPPDEQVFTPEECWAFRLGKEYLVSRKNPAIPCPHVKNPAWGYLCAPMMAQGETLGLFHLRFGQYGAGPIEPEEGLSRDRRLLASAVAEGISLSIANFKLRERLLNQSIHDPLTGLYNRRYMDDMLERELHRMARKNSPLGVIMLDIDHFKQFNDTYGHEAGDLLLKAIGTYLQTSIREEDFACRFGGEEFVIVLPETILAKTRERAEELRKGIKGLSLNYKGNPLGQVTVSLGSAVFPQNGLVMAELLRAADAALYRAKAEGRDRAVSM